MGKNSYVGDLVAASWALGSVAATLVGIRLYNRLCLMNKPGWDDFFMTFALANAIVCSTLVTVGTSYGLGLHLPDLAKDDPIAAMNAIKYTIIAPNFSIIASTCGKVSIVIFLLRLLGTAATRVHKWFLWTATAILVLYNVFVIIIILGFCQPTEKIWNPKVEGWCMPPEVLLYGGLSQASYNALMDFITALFPAFMVSTLNMKTGTKWGLSALMGGGVFAGAATIVKVYMIRDITDQADITWSWAPITLWYTAEMYVIIITGTIPTLRPMFRLITGKYSTTNSYETYGHNTSGTGSSGLRKFNSRSIVQKPGPATIALQDIDNHSVENEQRIDTLRHDSETGASSVEDILPKRQSDDNDAELGMGHVTAVMLGPPNYSRPAPQPAPAFALGRSSPENGPPAERHGGSNGIYVTTEVTVDRVSPAAATVHREREANPYFPRPNPFR